MTTTTKELIKELYNKIDKESEWTRRYEVFEKHLQELPQQEVEIKMEKKDFGSYWICSCFATVPAKCIFCHQCWAKIKRID